MSEAEQQLRAILREHAADSEHLMDEVLDDARKKASEHTKYWYAVRLERLKQMAKERGFWPEMAAIIANGTATAHEPPTYAQQLNLATFRAEKAERSLSALREAVSRISLEVHLLPGAVRTSQLATALADAQHRFAAYDAAQVAQRCTLLPDDCGSPARCVAAGTCQSAVALTPGDVEANCRHCGRPQSSHRSLTVLECAWPYRTTFDAQKEAGRGR